MATHQRKRSGAQCLLRAVVIYVVLPYLSVVLIFTLFQRQLLYRPSHAGSLDAEPSLFAPHHINDVAVEADDGVVLHGWLVRSQPDAAPDVNRPLAIYYPGNSGHRGDRTADLREMAEAGVDVLIVDYRGYGDNHGRPNEQSLIADAQAIWRFATETKGYRPGQIILVGESLGGAVSTRLAADLCRQSVRPAGLIVISSFASLADVVAWHYPAFPFQYLLFDRYDSAAAIKEVACPVIVIHGTGDEFVPLEQGQRLFDAAPARSLDDTAKEWREVAGMGHNDVPVRLLQDGLRSLRK